jgi:hypothetical protein
VPATGRYFIQGSPAGSYTVLGGATVPFVVSEHGFTGTPSAPWPFRPSACCLAAAASYELRPWFNTFVELNYGSSETKGPV